MANKEFTQVNATFDPDQIAWLDYIAKDKFRMTDRGARTHVVRVCVDMAREKGLLEQQDQIPAQQSENGQGSIPLGSVN